MALGRWLPLDHDGLIGPAAGDDILWRGCGGLLGEGDPGHENIRVGGPFHSSSRGQIQESDGIQGGCSVPRVLCTAAVCFWASHLTSLNLFLYLLKEYNKAPLACFLRLVGAQRTPCMDEFFFFFF